MFFFDKDSSILFKPRSLEHAYLAILNNDLKTAEAVFESLDTPRALWGTTFVEILAGFVQKYPTYFGIRNFMEIDLDFLIKNEKIEYVEQFLGSLEFLSSINREVYKYAARVMYENRYYKASKEYMEKSKQLFYNDPELQFMLAKYYINEGEYKMAENNLKQCLKIIPDYNPAIKLQKEIHKYMD